MPETQEKEKTGLGPEAEQVEGGISPAEQAELDQIAAGFRDGEEAEGGEDGGLYDDKDKSEKKPGIIGRITRRKALITGGVAGLSGLSIAGLLFVLPIFKIPALIANAEQKAMVFVVDAIGARSEHLFDAYMIKNILALKTCGASVSSVPASCRPDYGGSGLVTTLFATWRGAQIEEKIFDDLGFRLDTERNPNPGQGTFKYTLYDRRGNKVKDLTNEFDYVDFKKGQFSGGSRSLGKEIQFSLKQNTNWDQVLLRRRYRAYFRDVHDVKFWCFLACKTKDNVEIKKLTARTKVKSFMIQRFVYPMTPKLGFAMECLMKGSCETADIKQISLDRNVPEADLLRISEFVDGDTRLSNYVLERILVKVGLETAQARAVTGSVPIIGQIYLAVWTFDLLNKADRAVDDNVLSKLAADINSSQYREVYQGIRTSSDEIKAGALSLADIGALNNEFEGSTQSLVYQANIPSASVSLFGATAFAESTNETYTCANGKPIPSGNLVCEEKKVKRSYAVEDFRDNSVIGAGLNAAFANYRFNYCDVIPAGDALFSFVAKIVTFSNSDPPCSLEEAVGSTVEGIDTVSESVLGPVVDGALGLAGKVPVIAQFKQFITDSFGSLVQFVFGYIFPFPYSAESPGREKHDAVVAGSEVAAQDFGRGGYVDGKPFGLGAPTLSEAEARQVYLNYQDQLDYEYQKSSLFAKIINVNNERSLAFQLVQSSPNSPQQSVSNFAASIFNVFGLLGRLALPVNASSNSTTYNSPFGIERHGYPIGSSYITMDPGELTEDSCKEDGEYYKKWQDSLTSDDKTGFEEYSTPNPCLLEQVVADSLGAYFTDE